VADPSMALPAGKTCGACAHVERCLMLGTTSRTATACDWSPSRFVEPVTPVPKPAPGAYVSPLWPPPGDPRAAHGAACPPSCSCHAEIKRRRHRGLAVVRATSPGEVTGG
jgi:hypothetical protein